MWIRPWGTNILNMDDNEGVLQKKCFCKKEHANSIDQHCIAIRYSLNFRCHKFCVEKQYFKEHLSKLGTIPLDDYLKELDKFG